MKGGIPPKPTPKATATDKPAEKTADDSNKPTTAAKELTQQSQLSSRGD